MRKKTDAYPSYEQDGFTFVVKDDGMLGKLTGFSVDYQKGFIRKLVVVDALYD